MTLHSGGDSLQLFLLCQVLCPQPHLLCAQTALQGAHTVSGAHPLVSLGARGEEDLT